MLQRPNSLSLPGNSCSLARIGLSRPQDGRALRPPMRIMRGQGGAQQADGGGQQPISLSPHLPPPRLLPRQPVGSAWQGVRLAPPVRSHGFLFSPPSGRLPPPPCRPLSPRVGSSGGLQRPARFLPPTPQHLQHALLHLRRQALLHLIKQALLRLLQPLLHLQQTLLHLLQQALLPLQQLPLHPRTAVWRRQCRREGWRGGLTQPAVGHTNRAVRRRQRQRRRQRPPRRPAGRRWRAAEKGRWR